MIADVAMDNTQAAERLGELIPMARTWIGYDEPGRDIVCGDIGSPRGFGVAGNCARIRRIRCIYRSVCTGRWQPEGRTRRFGPRWKARPGTNGERRRVRRWRKEESPEVRLVNRNTRSEYGDVRAGRGQPLNSSRPSL